MSNKKPKTKADVMKIVKEQNVMFIRIWFTDILGQIKSFSITRDELEGAFDEGMGFDGSSIAGYARIDESDMIAKPDPSTFQIIPWRTENKLGKTEHKVGRLFCDVLNPDGTPYVGDPRYAFKRNLQRIKKKGYTFYLGPELEFFYFKDDQGTEVLDKGGYFDLTTLDAASDHRRDTVFTLEAMGIKVEYSHHEVAPSQHEIDLRYAEGLEMADNVMTYRVAVKEVATKYGCYATFMPKPIFGQNGSGMHVHQSLFKGKKNLFYNGKDEYNLSDMGKSYIAGILHHAPEITAFANQWVNSYKRLVPGYEAPVYIAWARRNRSALVRVPMYKPGKEQATRMELRSPDPACNPYLAFSMMLAAGLEGIEKGYKLPDPVEKDIFKLTKKELKKMGIKSLPGNLIQAVGVIEKSDLARKALGDHIVDSFIANKRIEWDNYRTQVHPYELDKYLSIL